MNSFILQAPPYNFTPGINGLINIPAMSKYTTICQRKRATFADSSSRKVGHAVGALLGGYLTDVYVRWRARRNEGIFEPESRLPLLVLPAICVPIGCLMFGFAVQEQMSWAVIFVAYGFINVGLTGVANIGMTYVMDSYFPVAADALLVVNGLKNVVAFGFSYGAVPWITGSGYKDVSRAVVDNPGTSDADDCGSLSAPWRAFTSASLLWPCLYSSSAGVSGSTPAPGGRLSGSRDERSARLGCVYPRVGTSEMICPPLLEPIGRNLVCNFRARRATSSDSIVARIPIAVSSICSSRSRCCRIFRMVWCSNIRLGVSWLNTEAVRLPLLNSLACSR